MEACIKEDICPRVRALKDTELLGEWDYKSKLESLCSGCGQKVTRTDVALLVEETYSLRESIDRLLAKFSQFT